MFDRGIAFCYSKGDADHDHAVTQMGNDQFTYDGNGNQITRQVGGNSYTLSYDAENHLVAVTGAVAATFVYDGDGNRVEGTIGGVTTTYIGNYFEWKTSTEDMVKYYYAGSTRVAMRTAQRTCRCPGANTLNYLLGDHPSPLLGTGLGSQSITTDSNGANLAEIRYYPWGTERYSSGTTQSGYRFTGQRLESLLGLYFYNARWYDPAVGRFIQADTIVPGGVQGLDRYAYVENNPIKFTDRTGHIKSYECGPDGIYCDNTISFEEKYNISFEGIWTSKDKDAVYAAVKAVATKFGSVTGKNSAFVWNQVYGYVKFDMKCSVAVCGVVGGITNSTHSISFSDLDSGFLKARNNVIHELGHAFDNAKEFLPRTALSCTQTMGCAGYQQNFPDRNNFPDPLDTNWVGPNSGFASGQNQFTWQMSYSNAGESYEEFADQFLGWTFSTWESSPNGQERSNWMNHYMPTWLG